MITLLAWIGLATSSWHLARFFSDLGQQIQSKNLRCFLAALFNTLPLVIGGIVGANWHDLSWGWLAFFLLAVIAMGSVLVGMDMAIHRQQEEELTETKKDADSGLHS